MKVGILFHADIKWKKTGIVVFFLTSSSSFTKYFSFPENKDMYLPVKKPGESVKISFGPSYHNCEHGDFSIMYREVYMKISYL
jgi:hypothetical protein